MSQSSLHQERKRSDYAGTLLPGAALIGILMPLLFIERLQSYSYYMDAIDLLGVYGTTVLLLLPAAAFLTGAAFLFRLAESFISAAQRHQLARHFCELAFSLIICYGLLISAQIWLNQTNSELTVHLPRLRWVVLAATLCHFTLARFRTYFAALHGPAQTLAALALLTLLSVPFLRWEGADAPTVQTTNLTAKPNIVFITFDALTASHMSLYGYGRKTTPNLEAWAEGGTVLDRFYAASNYTTTSINSILTGVMGTEHGALQLMSWPNVESRTNSLPAKLKQAGYQTIAVSTNPLAGPYKNGYGNYFDVAATDQIFTYFSGRDGPSKHLKYFSAALDNPLIGAIYHPIRLAAWLYTKEQSENRHYDANHVFNVASTLLTRYTSDKRPFFLWIHLLPPHSPYATPAPFLGSFDKSVNKRTIEGTTPPFGTEYSGLSAGDRDTFAARYDESILYLDHALSTFLKQHEKTLNQNSITLISADHGESFAQQYGGHAGPLLSESLINIPMVIRGTGIKSGSRLQSVAGQIDIAPTIAELVGIAPSPTWQGDSFATALRSGREDHARSTWSLNFEQSPKSNPFKQGRLAYISQRWKYVHTFGAPQYPGVKPLPNELFDFSNGRCDETDVSAKDHDRTEEFARLAVARSKQYIPQASN